MKELDHIRKVENEISVKVERARNESEKKLAKMRRDRSMLIEEKVNVVRTELEKEKEKCRHDSEKEASLMLDGAEREVSEIEKAAKKNFDSAVKTVLGFLSYDKS